MFFQADPRMALTTLSLAELRTLPEEERLRRLSAFVGARKHPPNGEAAFLAEKIADFEKRYEMSSATMQRRLADGALRETADICMWLMLIEAKNSIVERSA